MDRLMSPPGRGPKGFIYALLVAGFFFTALPSFTVSQDDSQILDPGKIENKNEQEGRKMNLATRIMSNGVEVIIAGPSPAFRWENLDLQPTMTLSDSVVMVMPTEDPNEFVTKTCTTTFTYLNTITKDGRLFVSTDQQIVANTATEERHRKPGSESSAVTLEASPTLRTEIFKTTYTYLTLNAEYSDIDHALGSSQKVITNTITVPQHYLDMILEPSQFLPPRTNTYISTRRHKKTFVDNGLPKIKTDCETITQLIITDLATTLPRSTSVTTTLTALDYVEDSSVTDVSQPYYITHAYYDSYQEMKNNITIRPNLAISTDIEAEYASSRPPSINSQIFPAVNTSATSILTVYEGEILSSESVVENTLTNKCKDLHTSPQHSISVKNIVTGSTIIFFDEDDRIEETNRVSQIRSTVPMNHLHLDDEGKTDPNKHSESTVSSDITNSSISLIQEVTSDAISQSGTSQPVESLLNLGSLGINSLSALGPVITAMAGLLQKNTLTNHRRESTTKHPPLDSMNTYNVTTERSPIYIPVAEYIESDIETAESQDIAQQIAKQDPTLETRHRIANNLVNGISISPGEIITANSDVIVGKPGRLGPRPPQSHQSHNLINSNFFSMSVPHILAHPMLNVFKTQDKASAEPGVTIHDPLLKPPSRPNIEKYANPNINFKELDIFSSKYQRPPSQTLSPSLVLPIAHQLHDVYNTSSYDWKYRPHQYKENNQSFWILDDRVGNFSNYVGFKTRFPSGKITKPIVHQVPHIIDRSTGQPLLVNIQPSQIANVVIPQSGLQALVFGDSNEPHISGQYFDDPSPYSQSQKFQSTNTILTNISTAHPTITRPYDVIEIQTHIHQRKKPLEKPMIYYPSVDNKSTHGQVHTKILVHQPDSSNKSALKTQSQNVLSRRQYNQHQSRNPSGQISFETPVKNIYHKYGHSNKDMNKTISLYDNSEQQWENHRNTTALQNNLWLVPRDNSEHSGSIGIQQKFVHHVFSTTESSKSSNISSPILVYKSRNNLQPDSDHIVYHSMKPHVNIQYQDTPISVGNIQSDFLYIPQRHQVSSVLQYPKLPLEHENLHYPEIQTFSNILSSSNNDQTWFNIHTELNSTSYDSQAELLGERIDRNSQVDENKDTEHSNSESPLFLYPFLNQKKIIEHKTTNTSVNRKNMNQTGLKFVKQNLNENLAIIEKDRDTINKIEKSVVEDKKDNEELMNKKSYFNSVYIQPFETSFENLEASESYDATQLNQLETIPYSTKSLTDPSAFPDIGFPYAPTGTYSRQKVDMPLHPKEEIVTSSNIHIQSHELNQNEPQKQTSSQLILNTHESPLNIIRKYKLDQKHNNNEQSFVSKSGLMDSRLKLLSQPVQLSKLDSLLVQSEYEEPVNSQDQKHHIQDHIKPLITELSPMVIHAKDDKLSLKTSYHVDFVTKDYDSDSLSATRMNSRTRFKIPSREIRPPPPISDSKPKSILRVNKGTGLKSAQLSDDIVGMTPPPPKVPKINEYLTSNQRSELKSALQIFGINTSKKFSGKNRPVTFPSLNIAMEPPIALTTRSVVVDQPSQNMVPPSLPLLLLPPTFQSAAPGIVNLRPAIAVSGSIQIATEVARSNIPVMRDFESSIPIVHGTVDFSVSADFTEFENSIETEGHKFINRHISRVLQGQNSPENPVSITQLSPVIFLVESKSIQAINSSSTMHSTVPPVRSIGIHSLWTSRQTSHSIVILETSSNTMSQSISQINPTKSFLFHDILHDVPESSMNVQSDISIIDNRSIKVNSDLHNPIILNKTKYYESSSIPFNDILRIDASKPILPTNIETKPKEVTRFKTLTITRTETLVVGSPPTTRTILLTHTITSTIVGTVTETLLRPTNVLATVTSVTTITLQSASLRSHAITPTDTMDSIFIVMSDRNLPAASAEAVEAEYGPEEEIFSRDEQDLVGNEFQRKISEMTFRASLIPPRTSTSKCSPECVAYKSEVCMEVNDDNYNIQARCVCRPGFARMFADRPCKPTYTYTLYISLERIGHQSLTYNQKSNSSETWPLPEFNSIIKEALDRTLMQSDLRDIYQSLNIVGFHQNFTNIEFNVQFTENTDEMKVKEVIKKYLAANNFSLGGTEVIASPDFEKINAQDFNECMTEKGGPYHDCSPQAVCVNRRGYYECLCKEGWTDISENPLYTGRQCSRSLTGCSKCNYNGHCMRNSYGQNICECFHWHTGQNCQLNLKVLFISLVIAALILFSFLGICLVIICFKSTNQKRTCVDRHKIIAAGNAEEDTLSKGSITDLAIPHHIPHILPIPQKLHIPLSQSSVKCPKKSTKADRARNKHCTATLLPRKKSKDTKFTGLNVMIPRAKYGMSPQSPQQHSIEQTPINIFSTDKTKLLRSIGTGLPGHCGSSQLSIKNDYDENCEDSDNRVGTNTLKNGALVSAGFQVSATVTKHINHDSTVENVHAIPKKKYQDSSDSTDSTSILTRPWDTSTVQIMTGLLPFDIVNKKPNSDKMSVEKRSINHASNDNQDAQDRTSENVMGSTLRLRHTSSHNLNEIASNCNLNFDSV